MSKQLQWLQTAAIDALDIWPEDYSDCRNTQQLWMQQDGELWGHALLRDYGHWTELACIVISEQERGKGLSHQLIENCLSKWQQDLAKNGNRSAIIFAYTRSPALQKTFKSSGFVDASIEGNMAINRLFSFKAKFKFLQHRSRYALRLLYKDPKRLLHQLKHINQYKLYYLLAENEDENTRKK